MRAFKTGILIATVVTTLTVTYFSQNDDVIIAANHCQNNAEVISVVPVHCMHLEQESSWMSWITGDSRSAQFHYLDLLELLTSSDEPKKARSLSPHF
ncbi:hypothetical protein HH219_05475 [Pseudoalteromonas sp. NEC-BIFX-2020_015]|uniref:hypothetical protein n=1 Tax=Pseudoalteromonas sp. NEC-BIFX-2020_015 TaxID=2729544 RepID=UPI0014615570|nr:hypothetical protein [Pseudoalteromonas sp. NEC-BIFX-2020_015]NMR25011.1 hypothetical protein [Pseudoalteromonas sp. NEC-BIFX-2020_015]